MRAGKWSSYVNVNAFETRIRHRYSCDLFNSVSVCVRSLTIDASMNKITKFRFHILKKKYGTNETLSGLYA